MSTTPACRLAAESGSIAQIYFSRITPELLIVDHGMKGLAKNIETVLGTPGAVPSAYPVTTGFNSRRQICF